MHALGTVERLTNGSVRTAAHPAVRLMARLMVILPNMACTGFPISTLNLPGGSLPLGLLVLVSPNVGGRPLRPAHAVVILANLCNRGARPDRWGAGLQA